ncbi:DNA repair protein RadC [Ornithinibacillus halophilus]|uniref:DNA repair protein RadC n=1 Tax=Ornithinibacillus halophilus TaxID=930117 RepID=A0A1M5DEA4_9BACI|nr:DNA repair protein RadC [Ornithinibacillus halophilus]
MKTALETKQGVWLLPYDPSPSQEDIHVTRRLVESGKMIGIEVLDHLVIGDRKFVSLKEKGYL